MEKIKYEDLIVQIKEAVINTHVSIEEELIVADEKVLWGYAKNELSVGYLSASYQVPIEFVDSNPLMIKLASDIKPWWNIDSKDIWIVRKDGVLVTNIKEILKKHTKLEFFNIPF